MLGKLGRLFQPKSQRPYQLFQVEPSLECNLTCVMCPWSDLRPDQGLMSWDTFSRIAENFHLTEGVDLTGGGEPTTHPRLFDMVRVAKEAGCSVGFSTNGLRLSTELAETVISLGQDWLSFSVDGATAATYNNIRLGSDFDMVTRHIRTLHELIVAKNSKTPQLMLVFVMMKENYHELPAYVDLAYSLGVKQVIAKNLDVILREEDDARRLFSHDGGASAVNLEPVITEAKKRAYKLGVSLRLYALQPQELTICEHNPLRSLFINWAGDISPCITLSYAEERVFNGQRHVVPCQRFGNINQEPLDKIWQKIAYQQFRQSYEVRLRLEREATFNLLLGGPADEPVERPPAPEGCRTCY
jgi:MoaA/NifB/PqqE/SkfB family radical SAM enzyme